nr:MAG: ORF1 [TTV-like mini virus]
MPYFFNRRWYRPRTSYNFKRRYRKRWFRPFRWRTRRTLRRKRRRRRVRKRTFYKKRKLKTLKLVQWQPELIRHCRIKGMFTMFQGARERWSNNYIQYRDSLTPEFFPGGGGWGLFVFNLGALFDEFLRIRNWWTFSNINLPLVRYLGCNVKFYRDDFVDYIVTYNRNYPMTDSALHHANAQPSRMLSQKHKIIVQSRAHTQNKKPYVRRRIKPPRQIINKWFFQREMVNTNLIMFTASATSLSDFDVSYQKQTNNITLITLNPRMFPHINYDTHDTLGWRPKSGLYFYGTNSQSININNPNPIQSVKYSELIYLGTATSLRTGNPIGEKNKNELQTYFSNTENWGNIFHEKYLNHEWYVITSNVQYTNWNITNTNETLDPTKFNLMIEPIYIKVRYNPDRDTGEHTKVYFVPNFQQLTEWKEPENEDLKFSGFPLWMLLWGWPDWQKKLSLINQIDDHYILIVESPYFEPKQSKYMFLDMDFIENKRLYPEHGDDSTDAKPLLTDQLSWHPKFKYQQKSVDAICMCGPGAPKYPNLKSLQAHMGYSFSFKWGGSPSSMETIANPAKQPSYPVPGNFPQGLQIQDPTYDPTNYIYTWDTRREYLTQKAVKRLTEDQTTYKPILPITESYINPHPRETTSKDILETLIQAQTTEEEKTRKVQLYQQLREQQQLLNNRLRHLILSNIK